MTSSCARLAQARLDDLIRQRDELNTAIDELKEQLEWGERMLGQIQHRKAG